MTLLELLISSVIPRIKLNDRSTRIGEGTQAEVYDKFLCEEHKNICFKIFYPHGEFAEDEYTILKQLYRMGLPVPKPVELFKDYNTFCMEKIEGFNLEEITNKGLLLSLEVIDAMTEALMETCAIVDHGDLSPRNVMFGDLVIEDGIIIDAVPYIIDFGHSKMHPCRIKSFEYINIIRLMKKIVVPP